MDDKVPELYQFRFQPEERARKQRVWAEICRYLEQRYVGPADTVLDVGAGDCSFVNQIRCARRLAVDLSPHLPEHAGPGVEPHVCDLAELPGLGLPPVDVVFASNVFEHVRSKELLITTLEHVHGLLRPGGRLIVMQPNLRYMGGEYWDFLDHHIPLTHRSMEEVLHLTGFEIEELRPRFLPYTTKSRLPQHPALVWLYLRCRPAHRLLGRQMLVIARKPVS